MNKIKNILETILIIFLFIGMLCICSFIETNYSRKGIVIDITNNLVSVKDEAGNIWNFKSADMDLEINDEVKLMMNTNNTDNNIYDDIVKKYKKIN